MKPILLVITLSALLLLTACDGSTTEVFQLTDEATLTPTVTEAPTTALIEITAVSATLAPAYTVDPLLTPPTPTDYPTITPIPTLPNGMSPTEIKYRILEAYPNYHYCGTFVPIYPEEDEIREITRNYFIHADREELATIMTHLGLQEVTELDDGQLLDIFDQRVRLQSVFLELADASYRFAIVAIPEGGDSYAWITGVIDGQGNIFSPENHETVDADCPECLAHGTLIDTPSGLIPVQELEVGMLVWTQTSTGERIAAPIEQVSQIPVPETHQVVHVLLADGREMLVSPGHPTADGRLIGELSAGDVLDGAVIISAEWITYTGSATYDLLPAGDTGFYWANGVLIGSTLK